MRTMLVYGATGKAGRLVVQRALADGWAVVAFVRNPDKVPEAVRAKVTMVKGDLSDAAAVSAAVRSSRPDAIVDASSALPFGHARGQKANDADRGILTRATIDALAADGRLKDCVLVIVGGQLIAEPGGTIAPTWAAALSWLLRNVLARTAWREAEALVRWLFLDAPKELRFVYVRMGQMVEQPARGTLRPEPSKDGMQRGSASYPDVADVLVSLAGDGNRTWERQAIFVNYA